MDIYKNLDEKEVVDALSFFPGLKVIGEIKNKLTTEINEKIKIISDDNSSKNKDVLLSELIAKHFDLTAYESLNELESKGWGIQLFIRHKILSELRESNTSPEVLQRKIYELIKHPILNYSDYLLTFHPYDSTINDLTVAEAYDISETFSNNGAFKIIEDSPGDEDSLTHDQQDLKDIFDLCVSSAGNELATSDNPIVAATINLNSTDTKLKEDFGKYLTAKRKELDTHPLLQKNIKPGKYTSLIDHKVLQHIDLKILDIYVNGSDTLKQRQIADYLFPISGSQYDKDTTEAIRKSTIKYANEMLDDRVIKSLLISAGKLPFSPEH